MMMHGARQVSPRFTLESQNAAFLLLKLKALAADEVCRLKVPASQSSTPRVRLIPQETSDNPEDPKDEASDDEGLDIDVSQGFHRTRTVSMGSQESPDPLRISPSVSEETEESPIATTPDSEAFTKPPSSKLVGTIAAAPVKGVLKRKFSWKNYPELEGYLVEHREEYLKYSSKLNYTAEQKHYNNRLTQGLLDLASEQGYVFEDFTFAAIRDRIRCYFKSYIQAVKKKKRKKRA